MREYQHLRDTALQTDNGMGRMSLYGLDGLLASAKVEPLGWWVSVILIRSHTEKVAAGDLHQRLGIDSGDELQSLAETVNAMTDGISQALASRDAFQRILQAIIDPMIITDCNYCILQVNRPALLLLRAQEKNLIGQPFTSLFGPQGCDEAQGHLLGLPVSPLEFKKQHLICCTGQSENM